MKTIVDVARDVEECSMLDGDIVRLSFRRSKEPRGSAPPARSKDTIGKVSFVSRKVYNFEFYTRLEGTGFVHRISILLGCTES